MQPTPVRLLKDVRRRTAVTVAGSLLLLCAAVVAASSHWNGATVVATVGTRTITASELDALAKDRLARLKNEEYTIRRQVLEEHLSDLLLKAEARNRSVPVEELTRVEIESKVPAVTREQARAILESRPQRAPGQTDAEALTQIEASLRQSRMSAARKRFVDGLRTKLGARILLEPPRAALDPLVGPSRGPRDAPITIVEFADFQCPYCRSVTPTLRQLQERYGDKVRFVFRHFPLPNHKEAPKAAEASACAAEQNRFWEMHDKLFENPSGLGPLDLKRRAADAGLDMKRFDVCLDSGRLASVWERDRSEGLRFGVSATPTFFINGRMVRGAVPLNAFTDVIDEELERDRSAHRVALR